MLTDFPTLGVRIELWVALGVLVALIIGAIISFIVYRRKGGYWHSSADVIGWFFSFGVAVMVIGLALALIPYQPHYWQMYRVDTTVQSVTNTFTDSGGELTSTPIVQLEGVDRPVEVKDPRILNLNGRDVEFMCTMGWHYQAADTYQCKIRNISPE